jgi:hypothetical protein
MDRHAKLALCRQNTCDPATTAHPHILSQGDFGGHHEGQLDGVTFRDLEIGVEERSTSAQVLGKAATLALGPSQANADRKLEVEALRRATLKVNLIGAHGFSDSRGSNMRNGLQS